MPERQPINHQEADSVDVPRREVVRITANLPEPVFDALKNLASERGTSMTEQIRRAVSTEKFIDGEREKGTTFYLEDSSGGNRREIIFCR